MINSMINSDKIETEELNDKADKVEKSEDVTTIIKEYEEIIMYKNQKHCMHRVSSSQSF